VHVALLLRGGVVAQQPASPGDATLTFTLTPAELLARTGTVRLRVVDASGAAVTKAKVALHDDGSSGGGEPVDAEGRATLRHLQPGRLRLEVMGSEQKPRATNVDVRPGTELDLGDVVLLPTTAVDFRIEPFSEGTVVQVTCLEPDAIGKAQSAATRRAGMADASLKLIVGPGRHAVFAVNKHGCALLEFDTSALPALPIVMALRPQATLRLDNRVGTGLTRATIRSAAGVVVHESEYTGTSERDLPVPAGTYTATLVGMNGTATKQVAVGTDGGTLVVE
jgi:hypothetical protein